MVSDSKKKILVVSTFFLPHVGGVEVYTRELFSRLQEEYTHFEIVVLTLNTDQALSREQAGGLQVYRVRSYGWPSVNPIFSMGNLWTILRDIDFRGFDIIITQCRYYFFTNIVSFLASRYHIPLIHIEHNSGYMRHNNRIIEWFAWVYDIFVSPVVLARAQSIICVSEGVQCFIEHHFRSVSQKTRVIRSGIDVRRWSSVVRIPKAEGSDRVLFYGGRLIRSKGIYILLECMESLWNQYPGLKLYIAGTGPEEDTVKRWIRQRGKDSLITVCGRLNHDEMRAIFSEVDIYVNPSFYSEGLQISLLEAACSGLPIVSTDVGGSQEVLIHRKSGIIVAQKNEKDLERGIRVLLEDDSLREALGEQARRSVIQKFSWGRVIKDFAECIRKSR